MHAPSPPSDPPAFDRQAWTTLLVLCGVLFLDGLDVSMVGVALSIITTTFAEGPARNRALGIYTATGASGFSLGLVLGGVLTTAGWRWTFLLPFPIAVVLLVVAWRTLPPAPPLARRAGRFDLAGAATVTGAMLALVFGIAGAPDAGWTSAQTVVALAVAAALGSAFLAIEHRVPHPLVRLGILRSPAIAGANLAGMAVFACYFGFQFMTTLYMQRLLGWSALETALAFLPAGLLVAFGAPRMGALATRFGTAPLITAGLLSFVAGYALFIPIDASPAYPFAILPTMLLLGLGFALTYPAVNMAATSGVADHEQGLASGLVSTSFQLGGAVGLAIITAVITSGTTGAESLLDELRPGLAVVTGLAVLGLTSVLGAVLAQRRVQARLAAA